MGGLVMSDGGKPIEFSEYQHFGGEGPTLTDLSRVYSDVQSGKYRDRIEGLRDVLRTHGKDAYRDRKKHLPAWSFAARFEGSNRKDNPFDLSGYACLDFDGLSDAEGLLVLAGEDPYVYTAFRSPSGDGLKVVVRLDPLPEVVREFDVNGDLIEDRVDAEYQLAYQVVEGYFARKWDLSPSEVDSTKDVNRLCFVSYDPDAIWNPGAIPFDWSVVRGMPSKQALDLANAVRGHRNLVGSLVFAIKRLHGWDDVWRDRVLSLYQWACGRQCEPKDYEGVVDEAVASADGKAVAPRAGGSSCGYCVAVDPVGSLVDVSSDRLRWVDGKMHCTRGLPVWVVADKVDVDAIMLQLGCCQSCKFQHYASLVHAIRTRDRQLQLSRCVTFWVGDAVWVVGAGSGRARFRPASYGDLLRFEPSLSLPHPQSGDWREFGKTGPDVIDRIWGRQWLLGEAERDWNRRFMSRAFDESQRRGPFFLGWSSTGKSVFQNCVAAMLPEGACETISGQDLDQYSAADLMTAVFVFVDDAQDVPSSGWSMAQSRSGKGRGRVRAMRESRRSRANESSLMAFAEVDGMGFTRRFRRAGGWTNRLAYQVLDKLEEPVRESVEFEKEMLSERNLQDLAMWVIDGDNGTSYDLTKTTPSMAGFAKEVWAAADVRDADGNDAPTAIRDADGNAVALLSDVSDVASVDSGRANLERLANVMAVLRSSNGGSLPSVSVIMHSAREAGVRSQTGKDLREGTARQLINEVMADRELCELVSAEELAW